MNAVIAGATGLTGSALLKTLLNDPQIKSVVAFGRKSVGVQNPKLRELIISDLAEISKHTKELAGDVYFCCLGTTIKAAGSKDGFAKVDYTAVIDFARIAKQNQAKAFAVVSASSANSKSSIFYSQLKGETEEVLKKLGLTHLIIFQPALLIGNRIEKRPAERFLIRAFSTVGPLLPNKLKKSVMTSVDHLANRILQETLHPGSSSIKTIAASEI